MRETLITNFFSSSSSLLLLLFLVSFFSEDCSISHPIRPLGDIYLYFIILCYLPFKTVIKKDLHKQVSTIQPRAKKKSQSSNSPFSPTVSLHGLQRTSSRKKTLSSLFTITLILLTISNLLKKKEKKREGETSLN